MSISGSPSHRLPKKSITARSSLIFDSLIFNKEKSIFTKSHHEPKGVCVLIQSLFDSDK